MSDRSVSKNSPLETAPLGKLLFSLALPTVFAQIVNLLYNMVDRIFVGRIPGTGSLALAGLGVSFPIIILISAFAALIGMGGAPRAAIMMGQKNKDGAERILGNSVCFLLILSVALTVIFMAAKEPILLAFGASLDTLPYADRYLTIYLCGTIFVQFSLGLNQFISTQGFAKTSMITVLIGAVLNIILDPIFIYGLQMGVSGAALATIISQGVSAVWVTVFLMSKHSFLKIRPQNLRLRASILLPVLALGLSPFIMQATECLVQLTFNRGMQTYGNDNYVGAVTILFSLCQMLSFPLHGLTQGAQPIISYNFGAGNVERVRKTFRMTFITSLLYSLIGAGSLIIFPEFFVRLFSNDPEIIRIGSFGLRIYIAGMTIFGAQTACQQTFLALGQAKISLFLSLLRKVILLIPLALLLPKIGGLGTLGLYLAEPISDVIAVITTTTLFLLNFNKIMAHAGKQEKE
ncbi:MATE family efflux transporter [Qiania dongpingensis]|uniref:Multidrug export protein MepA n=1 Tax=Qiania dongpingensis TaxID=2763669 RepID=A0A7G9G7F8_9FIRM|nr:MATE family efflux transporter [Qiania dongpingensis]QNM06740.1 MATE family efflux transporter [Qiania dongpingensis]